jgi:uncharacterized protein YhdP
MQAALVQEQRDQIDWLTFEVEVLTLQVQRSEIDALKLRLQQSEYRRRRSRLTSSTWPGSKRDAR